MIKGTTKILGVIGDPIEHSLSPIMHNAAISHLGVDYIYLPLRIKPADLATALAGFTAIGVQGFNVTIPHKQAILPLLTEITPLAQAVGAVNTVYPVATGWGGTNTDVPGFLAPLHNLNNIDKNWSQKVALILGYGGAARAVVAGCAELGCAEIHVVGRQAEKLTNFQQSWVNSALPAKLNLQVHPWDNLPNLIPKADLLVNTTPVGMYPHIDQSPLEMALIQLIQPGTIVYDLIYRPKPTLLLHEAAHQGALAIDGLEMLVQQGAVALNLWLGRPIPVDIMSASLQMALKSRD